MIRTFTKRILLTFGLVLCSTLVWSQTTISGTIVDTQTNEPLLGASVVVKGTVTGTISNLNGEFSLKVSSAPPVTISVSMVGYTTVEIEVTESNVQGLELNMEESAILGQEVVVSASRVEESILQSPTSVEKMDILQVQNTSADDYYKGLANIKGVDMNTSSINFQIVNTRGFGSNGNTRFVQLTDGMDTQAPALNFPIGNLNGPNVLDVESMELIPGASSAIYGAGAFNGILLVNSKNPFDYQGVSAYYKAGVNHVGGDADQDAAPMHEVALRYAKAFNNKIAFKVSGSYMQADDWYGTSQVDRLASINPFASIGGENPGADRLHMHGDEANLNMNILRFSTTSAGSIGWQSIAQSTRFGGTTNAWEYARRGFLPNHVVAAPAYEEQYIVDYDAKNAKANVGLFWRVTDKMELSYLLNYGFGTSVYTGAQRYSLQNFSIAQHRLQLRGDNFFVRAYTTRERSGDSYIAEFLGKRINDERFGGDVSNYLTEYPLHYLQSLFDQGITPTNVQPEDVTLQQQLIAHQYARSTMESLYPLTTGSSEFNTIKNSVLDGVVPDGPKFDDESNLYHYEGQYSFKNQISFLDLQVGATLRQYELVSNGTIFDDIGGVTINEYGGYAQASKKVAGDRLNILTSIRYDKNENFDGQLSPKLATVLTLAETHNIRASIQRGFRNPTTQGQYIDLNIISARLLGGLPQFARKYELTTDAYPVAVVNEFTNRIFETGSDPSDPENVAILSGNEFTEHNAVEPEKVTAFEIGYKSLIANKLMVDAVFYHNTYTDFITQIQVRKFSRDDAGNPNYNSLLRGSAVDIDPETGDVIGNTGQLYTNIDRTVTAQGAAIGLTYSLPANFTIGGNYNWNVLNEEDKLAREGFISEFNTPEHKFNLSFANRKVTDNLGFNITYRWQDEFLWQSSFAQGQVEAFSTLDAQVSYKLPPIKSVIKLGGSNLFSDTYNTSLGSPNIGTIYYVSVTFDQFMN